jgi:NADH:ubiquinone oxidoreductase subunit 5 (subunit L)/multisubunit Na+/H+ antiporter MnhA subunit
MYLSILFFPLIGSIIARRFGRILRRRRSALIATACTITSSIFSIVALYEVRISGCSSYIVFSKWISVELVDSTWRVIADPLTRIILVVVTFVSSLVHLYSIRYIIEDSHLSRFISYLSLFTFFMLCLITADNILQLFFRWERVRLASFLLISFWSTRLQASKAAIKAMIINRIRDVRLALRIFACYVLFRTVNYTVIFACSPLMSHSTFMFIRFEMSSLNIIRILLIIRAARKSAQLGLHTWLPDAIERPTPVSALIHAATIVTAGVFLLARFSPMLEFAPRALLVVTIFGAITAFFAATTRLVQMI